MAYPLRDHDGTLASLESDGGVKVSEAPQGHAWAPDLFAQCPNRVSDRVGVSPSD